MPDNTGDILNNLNEEQTNNSSSLDREKLRYLKSIDDSLKEFVATNKKISQSSARDYYRRDERQNDENGRRQRTGARETRNKNDKNSRDTESTSRNNSDIRKQKIRLEEAFDGFMDSFEDQLMKGLFGASIGDRLNSTMEKLAKGMGVSVEDIPKEFGAELGRLAKASLTNENTKIGRIGKSVTDSLNNIKDQYLGNMKVKFEDAVNSYRQSYKDTREFSFDILEDYIKSLDNDKEAKEKSEEAKEILEPDIPEWPDFSDVSFENAIFNNAIIQFSNRRNQSTEEEKQQEAKKPLEEPQQEKTTYESKRVFRYDEKGNGTANTEFVETQSEPEPKIIEEDKKPFNIEDQQQGFKNNEPAEKEQKQKPAEPQVVATTKNTDTSNFGLSEYDNDTKFESFTDRLLGLFDVDNRTPQIDLSELDFSLIEVGNLSVIAEVASIQVQDIRELQEQKRAREAEPPESSGKKLEEMSKDSAQRKAELLQDKKESDIAPQDAGEKATEKSMSENIKRVAENSEGSGDVIGHQLPETAQHLTDSAGAGIKNELLTQGETAIGNVVSGSLSAGEALAGVASAIGPQIIAFGALWAGTKLLTAAFAPAKEGLESLGKALKETASRAQSEAKQETENAVERLEADVETIISYPFEILEDAANKVYEVWDSALQTINATQGYTKSDLQDLMSNYAARLTEEGLSSVVSSADMTENLEKVLQAGMSGAAAEEFAYLATVLNAAIPTQDFFDYAESYVALASEKLAEGYTESEALEYANTQLEEFANSVLYASRELTGGFTSGLTNASDIFEKVVSIAQTSNNSDADVSELSSVLTAVSAVTGSISSDLASSMVDVIYNAAVGGNSTDLVALRSLAGINASNTEFLNQLVNDPQSVLSTLFDNLGSLINTSNDNYMEVAESLSDIFGISTEALVKIDWNYLADAIASLDTDSTSLEENIALLASGETTTSAEQQRMAQINEYILEEGLSYVLDNEAARTIQQHMWDEQLADELMEAEYAVNLKGSAMEALTGLQSTLKNVLSILNPFAGISRLVTNIVDTSKEASALSADIQGVLEAGVVGSGNAKDLYNLTTYGQDLNLTDDLLTIMTGTQSSYSERQDKRDSRWYTGSLSSVADSLVKTVNSSSTPVDTTYKAITSQYTWSTVGKSLADSLGSLSGGTATGTGYSGVITTSSTDATTDAVIKKLDQMLEDDYMKEIIESGGSYEDWKATASQFGISDLEQVIEDAGYSSTLIESKFETLQTQAAAEEELVRNAREETFWDNTEDYLSQQIELQTYMTEVLDSIYEQTQEFYDAWVDYYVNHTAYSSAYDHTAVSKIQSAEASGSQDAVYALAEALTQNMVDLTDPQIQTNAILSQILIVVNAIMQQNNGSSGTLSLADTLSGLALGLYSST